MLRPSCRRGTHGGYRQLRRQKAAGATSNCCLGVKYAMCTADSGQRGRSGDSARVGEGGRECAQVVGLLPSWSACAAVRPVDSVRNNVKMRAEWLWSRRDVRPEMGPSDVCCASNVHNKLAPIRPAHGPTASATIPARDDAERPRRPSTTIPRPWLACLTRLVKESCQRGHTSHYSPR